MEELIGKRIDIIECINPEAAHRGYGHNWLPLSSFKLGHQEPVNFFGKKGYCCWNAKIGISDYSFNLAYKKVATFVITKIACHICGTKTDFQCEKCDEYMCHDCQAPYNQFSQIDYNCCTSCYQTQRDY